MSDFFEKKIKTNLGEKNFSFRKVWYGPDLWYHVDFEEKGIKVTFRLRPEEEGGWVIAAQALPEWVHDHVIEYNDAIEENS